MFLKNGPITMIRHCAIRSYTLYYDFIIFIFYFYCVPNNVYFVYNFPELQRRTAVRLVPSLRLHKLYGLPTQGRVRVVKGRQQRLYRGEPVASLVLSQRRRGIPEEMESKGR